MLLTTLLSMLDQLAFLYNSAPPTGLGVALPTSVKMMDAPQNHQQSNLMEA